MELSEIKKVAQSKTRELLKESKNFPLLSREEQLSLYTDLYEAEKNRQLSQMKVSGQMAAPPPINKASDMIDKNRYKNDRIDQAGNIAKTFMDGVDFPKFVKDLLKGVFDANMAVVIGQMDEYIKLMKAATADVSKFVNAIDAAASFGYLAENSNDDFGLSEDDEGNQTLVGKDGEVLATALPNGKMSDIGDNELKAKIMDAKIKMAQEQRAILRETILMGVTRLVVERGTVKAGVIFDIKASEKIDLKDKAAKKDASSSSKSVTAGGGFIGKIFGGPNGGYTNSEQHSTISISSGKATNSTDLKAQVTGSVEIIFKSDYFKLDNFKDMYGGIKSDAAGTTKETQNVAQGSPRQ
jgi:hypothetical protein